MIENIPSSVVKAIKAASKDIAHAVKCGSYCPTSTRDLASSLEKFMMGMVAQSYPRVRSAWIDSDIDKNWIKAADESGLVNDEQLLKALEKLKPVLSPEDYDTVVRNNFSKFHGKKIVFLQRENPKLYDAYKEPVGGSPEGIEPIEPKEHTTPPMPAAPIPAPKKDEHDEPPAKQPLMKPGEVKRTPQDEFEKGEIPLV